MTTLAATQKALRDGRITATDVTEAHLKRIAEVDPGIEAWAFIDPDHALRQAGKLDKLRAQGQPIGPLHGVPVGVKDIFDTRDMPTEDGTPLHAGRRTLEDSTVVRLLREAGAVIMGKTVTTELATFQPGKTHHPVDPSRTPGGSSSGSAAAVASGMVPLAVGSQTNGSVIRPAAFCGVVGYKPTRGLISRRGMLSVSRTLDQVGVFAPTVRDAALIAEVLMDADPGETAERLHARSDLLATATSVPPLPPRVAFVRSPLWEQAGASTQEAFAELVDELGESVGTVELPQVFAEAVELHRLIQDPELAVSLAPEYERGKDQLSPRLRAMIESGSEITAAAHIRALARIPVLTRALDAIFDEFDAILTPATPGEAPGIETTGSPVFCTTWSLLGTPALSLPLMTGPNGLPLGVQLVGKVGDDARLLRTANWLWNRIATAA